jgi:hypothetical protein
MVDLVDHLVQARRMQSSVWPIMPGVFEDEGNGNLVGRCKLRGEAHLSKGHRTAREGGKAKFVVVRR